MSLRILKSEIYLEKSSLCQGLSTQFYKFCLINLTSSNEKSIQIARLKLQHVFFSRFQLKTPSDGQWGSKLPNGDFTGLIGMVGRGEVDLSLCAMTMTQVRSTFVDFGKPYLRTMSKIISSAPKRLENPFVVFTPFSFEVSVDHFQNQT